MEEKTRIAQAFLKRKEAEFEAIRREIEALKGELESSGAKGMGGNGDPISPGRHGGGASPLQTGVHPSVAECVH